MKILGAKHILNISEPKLVYDFWSSTEECRQLLENPTCRKVLSIIKHNASAYDNIREVFNIWIGDNGCQVCPLDKDYEGNLELTDINIVGDADPRETLWFVFEKHEWKYLDEYLNVKLSKILKNLWNECEKYHDKYNPNNSWAIQTLNEERYYKYKDIIEANVEIELLF